MRYQRAKLSRQLVPACHLHTLKHIYTRAPDVLQRFTNFEDSERLYPMRHHSLRDNVVYFSSKQIWNNVVFQSQYAAGANIWMM